MSRDQKPKPVKAVTIAGGGAPPGQGGSASPDAGGEGGDTAAGHDMEARQGFPVVPAILFLLGCAAGGAALTALPHIMPDFAPRLYGNRP